MFQKYVTKTSVHNGSKDHMQC